ncbi:hypothetical protein GP486_007784 [Trichoglossum hirsutum]|uniref:T6SS Phospholipase effector Tle1-like catalytic domain-containing protein n=1 Tax=Trichoglossum hirsutum TaxID=265104 RepID=A0A9P8IEW4_9PEZI|nr:hypothetical protein GP486_007784 [Trichoglossum hirsutum]
MSRPNKLVILCDGTWCGKETKTKSNIHLLAQKFGDMGDINEGDRFHDLVSTRGLKARYFTGLGLGGAFQNYIFDGATATSIGDKCKDVYQYIVEKYDDTHEIWMFGLSRGAFTIRCVAGMINNCGIIKREKGEPALLSKMAYQTYRSPYDEDAPSSRRMKRFRENASWNVKTPIKFMGLLDTVGSVGFPQLIGGVGLEWTKFHDQKVSSAVEKVYHALSMHDRLWCFEPCLALRDQKHSDNPSLKIYQKWFPGAHYDLARQEFRFLRDRDLPLIAGLVSNEIQPNIVLSSLVLEWMLKSMEEVDPSIIPGIQANIDAETKSIRAGRHLGSGDIYDRILDYAPFGRIISPVAKFGERLLAKVDEAVPQFEFSSHVEAMEETIETPLLIKPIKELLLALTDRRIPDPGAEVYDYRIPEGRLGGRSVYELANMGRYKSKTLEIFELYRLISPPGGVEEEARQDPPS